MLEDNEVERLLADLNGREIKVNLGIQLALQDAMMKSIISTQARILAHLTSGSEETLEIEIWKEVKRNVVLSHHPDVKPNLEG